MSAPLVTAPTRPVDTAVIHGRFQPLHVGHLEYLLAGKRTCRRLVVGITNPDPEAVVAEPTDPQRGLSSSNPCTFYERYLMLEDALVEARVPRSRFQIVPFPHGRPHLLSHYAPAHALYLLTIYDEWGEAKLARFQQLELAVHVMWRRSEKVTSGSAIRALIAADDSRWEALVPPAVARVIHRQGIAQRLRDADG